MLARLLRDEPDAVQADLRRYYNVRLSDMYCGYEKPSELAVYVFECQFIEGSALRRVLVGDDADWTTTNQLLALIADQLAIGNWFKTRDGEKGKNRPKQIPRPGVKDEEATTYGKGTALSREEMSKWLGWS